MTNNDAQKTEELTKKDMVYGWAAIGLLAFAFFLAMHFAFSGNYLGLGVMITLVVLLPFAISAYDDIKYDLSEFGSIIGGETIIMCAGLVILSPLIVYGLILEYQSDPAANQELLMFIPIVIGVIGVCLAMVLGFIEKDRLDKLIAKYSPLKEENPTFERCDRVYP